MLLKRPLVSEKSMFITKSNIYTFEVSLDARKEEIKKLIEEKFKVEVLSVKTLRVKGKTKMQRTRRGYYQTSPVKKALVQVAKGQKIALFESATKDEEVKVTTAESKDEVKEKKNLLKGTKVKVEKVKKEEAKKDEKKKTAKRPAKSSKQKSIEKKKGKK